MAKNKKKEIPLFKNSIIETHCHLDYLKTMELDEILNKSKDQNIDKIITIAVSPENLQIAFKLANDYQQIYCSQGIHPHDARLFEEQTEALIRQNAVHNKCVAIGEIGLDYHYHHSPKDIQKTVFTRQLNIALELNQPIIVHSREADQDTQELLTPFLKETKRGGVIHSFTSGLELAQFAIDAGMYLGFNGIITFNSAENVREVAKITPIEQILLETDAPFLTPTPFRGRENAPFYIPLVAQKIAEIKGIDVEEVINITSANAQRLFNLS